LEPTNSGLLNSKSTTKARLIYIETTLNFVNFWTNCASRS